MLVVSGKVSADVQAPLVALVALPTYPAMRIKQYNASPGKLISDFTSNQIENFLIELKIEACQLKFEVWFEMK